MTRAATGFLLIALSGPTADAAETRQRVCLSPAEMRVAIARNKLVDPMLSLRQAARHADAEALRAQLCRWSEAYVYEVSLLREDGRLVHVYIDAVEGKVLSSRNDH